MFVDPGGHAAARNTSRLAHRGAGRGETQRRAVDRTIALVAGQLLARQGGRGSRVAWRVRRAGAAAGVRGSGRSCAEDQTGDGVIRWSGEGTAACVGACAVQTMGVAIGGG